MSMEGAMPHPSDPARADLPIPFVGDPPAEAAWLRAAALWPHGGASAALPPPCDPDRLAAVAVRHRLVPVLHGFMLARGVPPPPPLTDALRAAAVRTLRQTVLLARLMPALEAAGVRALVLKGLPLSVQLYGHADLRSPGDIDILVAPDAVAAADHALTGLGCRLLADMPPALELAMLDKEAVYRAPDGEVVELHWRLTRNRLLLRWDFDDLWAEAASVALAPGLTVRTLPSTRLPVYLALHGAHHAWARGRWLVDAALALGTPDAADRALDSARTDGLEPVVLHALLTAGMALGPPVADRHRAKALADPRVSALGRAVARVAAVHAGAMTGGLSSWAGRRLAQIRLGLRLCPDRNTRMEELRLLFASPADRGFVQLPPRLGWLFPLLRPFLLALRLAGRNHPWRRRA